MNSTQGNTDSEPGPDKANVLEPIWKEIWTRRPILGEIMQKHGEKNLFEYTKDFLDVNKTPILDTRKEELFVVVREMAVARFGEKVADELIEQLRRMPLVSTTDHHATIQHPFFLNANIITALPSSEMADWIKYLVVFSFASTSLNNASAFAKGLIFHGDKKGSQSLAKISIFSDKEKMAATYNTRPFTQVDLDKALDQLKNKERAGEVSSERAEGVRDIFKNYFMTEDVLNAPDACTQLSKVSYKIWPQFFYPFQQGVPDLIYLEIETLVTEVLIRYHFNNPDSPIYQMLFNSEYAPLVLKHFNGIPGAFHFTEEKKWGTYLFWALDEKNHRVHMHLDEDGNNIASDYRTCVFPMTPEGLTEGLRSKKMFPAMFLCYLVVSLYYGMKCLGGFSQVNDLTYTKDAWSNFLREIGRADEADAIAPIQTKELGGDGMVLAYLKTDSGDLVPATGIDLLLEDADMPFSRYVDLAKAIRFKEIMAPMVPEIYKVLFTSEERKPEYLVHTPEQIMEFTGLQDKIKKFY